MTGLCVPGGQFVSSGLIDERDEVVGSRSCNVATDEAALPTALSWLGAVKAVEVWQGSRLVGRCLPNDNPAPSELDSDTLRSGLRQPSDHPSIGPDFHELVCCRERRADANCFLQRRAFAFLGCDDLATFIQ